MKQILKSRRFWDWIAPRYAKSQIADVESYQKKLDITQNLMTPDMHVLEIGCGTGSTAIAHAPYVHHILAVDLSEKMIGIARGKAVSANVNNISFEQSSIEALPRPAKNPDMIMAHSLLHLLDDKDAVISEIFDRLDPGGIFISSTSCIADTMGFFKALAPIGRFIGLLPMIRVFGKSELIESITAAGFVIKTEWQPKKGAALFVVAVKPDT